MALSEDEATRMLAESREKLRRDISAAEYTARKEGQEEGLRTGLRKGREEGREEGQGKARIAIARNLLQIGRPLGEIAEVTGLSPDEVMALQVQVH
jgi:predicted transposase YdaD